MTKAKPNRISNISLIWSSDSECHMFYCDFVASSKLLMAAYGWRLLHTVLEQNVWLSHRLSLSLLLREEGNIYSAFQNFIQCAWIKTRERIKHRKEGCIAATLEQKCCIKNISFCFSFDNNYFTFLSWLLSWLRIRRIMSP